MKNGLVSTILFSIAAMQRNFTLVLPSKEGFINYVFCRNWAVGNPAGTRLDSSSLVDKQVATGTDILLCVVYIDIVSVLGRDKGHTIKCNPLPYGVPEGTPEGKGLYLTVYPELTPNTQWFQIFSSFLITDIATYRLNQPWGRII